VTDLGGHPVRLAFRTLLSFLCEGRLESTISRTARGHTNSIRIASRHQGEMDAPQGTEGEAIEELTSMAKEFKVENAAGMRKQELIFRLLQAQACRTARSSAKACWRSCRTVRLPACTDYNYLPGPDDIYVSPSQIRRFQPAHRDTVTGQIRPPKDGERYFALLKVEDDINFEPPEVARDKILFDNLVRSTPREVQPGARARRTSPRGSSTCSSESGSASVPDRLPRRARARRCCCRTWPTRSRRTIRTSTCTCC